MQRRSERQGYGQNKPRPRPGSPEAKEQAGSGLRAYIVPALIVGSCVCIVFAMGYQLMADKFVTQDSPPAVEASSVQHPAPPAPVTTADEEQQKKKAARKPPPPPLKPITI